jgi:hypothetical protein
MVSVLISSNALSPISKILNIFESNFHQAYRVNERDKNEGMKEGKRESERTGKTETKKKLKMDGRIETKRRQWKINRGGGGG